MSFSIFLKKIDCDFGTVETDIPIPCVNVLGSSELGTKEQKYFLSYELYIWEMIIILKKF